MSFNKDKVWKKYHEDNPNKIFASSDTGEVITVYDDCGALIDEAKYDTKGDYGWEVDHIIPEVMFEKGEYPGDPHHPSNLRPLHWENNKAKGKLLDGNWKIAKEAVKDKNDGMWYNRKPEGTKWSKK